MKKIYLITVLFALFSGIKPVNAQVFTTLNPVQDAYFISMGGGQGSNPMLKFDISSIPAGSNIIKATLMVYVHDTTRPRNATSVMGNMIFRNRHNSQNWTESDSANKYSQNNSVYSDSVIMTSGFGSQIGWATSGNLSPIFLRDYNQGLTFCTISMKDPDDVTYWGGSGLNGSPFLVNSPDSIVTGNKMVGSDEMIFYPREYSNTTLRPKLIIEYFCFTSAVTANASQGTVCAGGQVTLSGGGASTYTWTGGVSNGIAFTPTTTATYTVTGTDANGCTGSASKTITVNPQPSVTATASSAAICAGQSTTITASGANTYTWNTGSTMTAITVNPATTTGYTVTGTDANGCISTAIRTVTVNALPSVMVVTSNSMICVGQSAVLTASGANTYTWSTSATGSSITVTPTVTTTYTVTGMNSNGCMNNATMTQNVQGCTGISQADAEQLKVYPNPGNGEFTLEVQALTALCIYNALGNLVYSERLEPGKHSLNMQQQPNGIYLVKAFSGNGSYYLRLIKQ